MGTKNMDCLKCGYEFEGFIGDDCPNCRAKAEDVIDREKEKPEITAGTNLQYQVNQWQSSLHAQLEILLPYATKLGCYDAADFIRNVIKK